MQILNLQLALEMTGGENEILKMLLEAYLNEEKFSLTKLQEIEKTDYSKAASYVHYYKGGARQIAAEFLADSGQKLEDELRGKSQGNIDELNRDFEEKYNIAIEHITKILQTL